MDRGPKVFLDGASGLALLRLLELLRNLLAKLNSRVWRVMCHEALLVGRNSSFPYVTGLRQHTLVLLTDSVILKVKA